MNSEGVPARLNPQNWQTRDASDLGATIQSGVKTAREAARQQETAAWKDLPSMASTPEALQLLPAAIGQRLGALRPDPQLTKSAWAMGEFLEGMVKGQPARESLSVFGPNPTNLTIDDARRRLLAMKNSADNPTDRAMADAIYRGYDDWVESAARSTLLAGDPTGAAKMTAARTITREVREVFEPSVRGTPTPGAKALQRILSEDATPESIVNTLFGSSSSRVTTRDANFQALTNLRAGLDRYAPSDVAQRTWDDIRHAYWLKQVVNKKGDVESPQMMLNNIRSAFTNQRSVVDLLYSAQEKKMIFDFLRQLEPLAYRPSSFKTNSSGTAFAGASMIKEAMGALWGALGLNSRLGQAATMTVPGVKQYFGAQARAATSADVREVLPSLGALGGIAATGTERARE